MTKFAVNPKTVDPNDVAGLYSKMYPEGGYLSCLGTDPEGNMVFESTMDVDENSLVKYMETNAASEKSKREDKALETQCKVIKYKGNYYLVDGTTRIPLFDD